MMFEEQVYECCALHFLSNTSDQYKSALSLQINRLCVRQYGDSNCFFKCGHQYDDVNLESSSINHITGPLALN